MSNSRIDELVIQLDRVNDEIKRLNERLNNLRQVRKKTGDALYRNMKSVRIEKAGKYTLNKLEKNYRDSEDKRRRTAQEKREDACNLCWEVGITDPQDFIVRYKKTQRTYDKHS